MNLAQRYTSGSRDHVSLALLPCQAKPSACEQRRAFLRALHPGPGFRDMRAIRSDGKVLVSSHDVANFDAVDAFAIAHGATANVFFGVATRANATGRKIEDCLELHCLFADFDFKDSSETDFAHASPRSR